MALVKAQNDGRYRPPTVRPVVINAGRYRPTNDGRYRPSNDGRYRGGNDGKYVHIDNKYVHDDRAGGAYVADNNPYRGDANRGGGSGGSGAGGNANAANAAAAANVFASTTTTRRPQPTRPVISNAGKSGQGNGGWAIIRLVDEVEQDGYHYLYVTVILFKFFMLINRKLKVISVN